jgi:hypothetical protein
MLLSLAAGGVGLNLVGANHLFLLDLHWNPQLEQQVCLEIIFREPLFIEGLSRLATGFTELARRGKSRSINSCARRPLKVEFFNFRYFLKYST